MPLKLNVKTPGRHDSDSRNTVSRTKLRGILSVGPAVVLEGPVRLPVLMHCSITKIPVCRGTEGRWRARTSHAGPLTVESISYSSRNRRLNVLVSLRDHQAKCDAKRSSCSALKTTRRLVQQLKKQIFPSGSGLRPKTQLRNNQKQDSKSIYKLKDIFQTAFLFVRVSFFMSASSQTAALMDTATYTFIVFI